MIAQRVSRSLVIQPKKGKIMGEGWFLIYPPNSEKGTTYKTRWIIEIRILKESSEIVNSSN